MASRLINGLKVFQASVCRVRGKFAVNFTLFGNVKIKVNGRINCAGRIGRCGCGKNTVSVRLQNLTKFTEINVKLMAVLLTLYYRPRKIIYHTIFGSVYG